MSRQEKIAQFVDANCPLPRMAFPYSVQSYPRYRGLVYGPPYAHGYTVESLAEHFVASAEFEALRLGGFFNTVQGHVIAEAIELVTPPFYRQDAQLIIDGLVYAADLQKRGNQRAGLIAVGAVVGGTVLAAGISRIAADAS
jgi:hypothetical protein